MISSFRGAKYICSIEFMDGSDCEYLPFIRHLFAVPLLLRVEWRFFGISKVTNLLKDCLQLTDKFAVLNVPMNMDMVTFFFAIIALIFSLGFLK